MKQKRAENIVNTLHMNDRILFIKIKTQTGSLIILQVYFPTSNSTEEELESMYEQIKDTLKLTRTDDRLVIMGDFNEIIGEDYFDRGSGKFGLGSRNERGERLIDFCNQYNLVAQNTMFEVLKRRRYTWISPG